MKKRNPCFVPSSPSSPSSPGQNVISGLGRLRLSECISVPTFCDTSYSVASELMPRLCVRIVRARQFQYRCRGKRRSSGKSSAALARPSWLSWPSSPQAACATMIHRNPPYGVIGLGRSARLRFRVRAKGMLMLGRLLLRSDLRPRFVMLEAWPRLYWTRGFICASAQMLVRAKHSLLQVVPGFRCLDRPWKMATVML